MQCPSLECCFIFSRVAMTTTRVAMTTATLEGCCACVGARMEGKVTMTTTRVAMTTTRVAMTTTRGTMRSYFGGLLCVCWSPDGR